MLLFMQHTAVKPKVLSLKRKRKYIDVNSTIGLNHSFPVTNLMKLFHHGASGTVLGNSLFAPEPTIIPWTVLGLLSHHPHDTVVHWILMAHLDITCYINMPRLQDFNL